MLRYAQHDRTPSRRSAAPGLGRCQAGGRDASLSMTECRPMGYSTGAWQVSSGRQRCFAALSMTKRPAALCLPVRHQGRPPEARTVLPRPGSVILSEAKDLSRAFATRLPLRDASLSMAECQPVGYSTGAWQVPGRRQRCFAALSMTKVSRRHGRSNRRVCPWRLRHPGKRSFASLRMTDSQAVAQNPPGGLLSGRQIHRWVLRTRL